MNHEGSKNVWRLQIPTCFWDFVLCTIIKGLLYLGEYFLVANYLYSEDAIPFSTSSYMVYRYREISWLSRSPTTISAYSVCKQMLIWRRYLFAFNTGFLSPITALDTFILSFRFLFNVLTCLATVNLLHSAQFIICKLLNVWWVLACSTRFVTLL